MAFIRTFRTLRIGFESTPHPSVVPRFVLRRPPMVTPRNLVRAVSTLPNIPENTAEILEKRDKPNTISYFTGNWQYNDLIIFLEKLINTARDNVAVATKEAHLENEHKLKVLREIAQLSDAELESRLASLPFISRHLCIRSFSPAFSSIDLAEVLSRYGQVEYVHRNDEKHYARVTFSKPADAIKAKLDIEHEPRERLGLSKVKVDFSSQSANVESQEGEASEKFSIPAVARNRKHLIPLTWKSPQKMSEAFGFPLSTSQWRKIVERLLILSRIPHRTTELHNELLRFSRFDATESSQTRKVIPLDQFGRAAAVGRRKEASARVWVVEGNEAAGSGHVKINGEPLSEYFDKLQDREEVLAPLAATNLLGKYNVWCVVGGGGSTGQAGAVKLGIGKALLMHDFALKPILRKAGCIARDPRTVERKKPGLLKARKAPTWVKR